MPKQHIQVTGKMFGQNKNESTVNFIDKLLKTPIDVQYGWSAIDDDGKPFRELLNLSNWNIGFLPSRVAVLKSFHPLLKAKLDFARQVHNEIS